MKTAALKPGLTVRVVDASPPRHPKIKAVPFLEGQLIEIDRLGAGDIVKLKGIAGFYHAARFVPA
jgi:hypothetical protein